jgi:hypothetical protein
VLNYLRESSLIGRETQERICNSDLEVVEWKEGEIESPALVLRLIVLMQLSSCSVERAFSQLELIRQRCGEKMFDDLAVLRKFLQSIGNVDDLYHARRNSKIKITMILLYLPTLSSSDIY